MAYSALKLHQETVGKRENVISWFLMRPHLSVLTLQHAPIVKVIRSLGEDILKLRVGYVITIIIIKLHVFPTTVSGGTSERC